MTASAERVRARLAQLDRQQQYYFFERIVSPNAFDVLAQANAFADVTAPELVDGQIVHYAWPPTLYLRNVIGAIPVRVAELVRGIDTDNQRVTYDMAELVEKMPAEIQASLVEKLCGWLERPQIEPIWSTYVGIARSLAQADEVAPALLLARRVLRLTLVEGEGISEISWRPRHAVAEMGDINYDHALERLITAFVDRHVFAIATVMRDILDEALKLEDHHGSHNRDFSSIWAKSLDVHPIGPGAKEALTYRLFWSLRNAVRDTALELADALTLFHDHHWPVFRRMRLALLTEFGSADDMAAELRSRDFMGASEIDRERDALLSKLYPKLNDSEKSRLWRSIRASLVSKKRLREHFRTSVADHEVEQWVERARRKELFDRLQPIGPYLIGKHLTLFAQLKAEFPPDADARQDDGEVWVGPQAPDTLEALDALSTSEILQYVERWRAAVGKFMAPSPEGLGRIIAPIAERRYTEILREVDRLVHWPPVYVWHVIDGLRKRVAEAEFDTSAFLELLSYVHLQSDAYSSGAFSPSEVGDDEERAWPTLGTITAFALADIMRAVPCEEPFRSRVWDILRALSDNQDPTAEDDIRHGNSEPWNYALNSVRGAAMLTVFDYARWVHRAHGGDAETPNLSTIAPELFEVLDERLDVAREPSQAVRATYGQNFVSVFAMARSWTIPAIPRIFGGTRDTRLAAWRTYLTMSVVYDEIYEHLKDYYLAAVEALAASNDRDNLRDFDSAQGLAAHVVRVYARGLTKLDESESLIRRFLRAASPRTMGAAIRSAGSGASSGDLSLEIWDRLRNLYESVLARYADRPLDDRRSALEMFGFWVIAPSLDRAWALDALSRTLRLTSGQISIRDRVLEWLATVSESNPYGAVTVLRDMMEAGTPIRFAIDDSFRIIVSRAVSAEGEAYRVASQVDERLAAIGVHQFHELFRRSVP